MLGLTTGTERTIVVEDLVDDVPVHDTALPVCHKRGNVVLDDRSERRSVKSSVADYHIY